MVGICWYKIREASKLEYSGGPVSGYIIRRAVLWRKYAGAERRVRYAKESLVVVYNAALGTNFRGQSAK